MVASHTDAQIYRKYALDLYKRHEESIANLGIADCILAYRRFVPTQCNVDFAGRAFCFVRSHAPCVACAFDIKDFFETLDHRLLKIRWKGLLGVSELPQDHYAVFKAITKYSLVNRDELMAALGITKKKEKNWWGALCNPSEFRELIRGGGPGSGLINTRYGGVGIPQGSPISCVLSNIFMLELDQAMAMFSKSIGGLYLRYSDDILLVGPLEKQNEMKEVLLSQLSKVNLDLNQGPGKVSIANFRTSNMSILCDRPLQYLGFTYDGQNVRIRSQTIARFDRRMRKAVRLERFRAKARADKGEVGRLRKKNLYRHFSHLGKRNFISYVRKASKILGDDTIRIQIRRHWETLNGLIVEAVD